MQNFTSINGLFKLNLPKGWTSHFKDNIYSFFNKDSLQGVLQISAFIDASAKDFDIAKELIKEERLSKVHATPITLSDYDCIHYGKQDPSEHIIQYVWIVGGGQTRLFCTLTMNSNQSEADIDRNYELANEVLNSLLLT